MSRDEDLAIGDVDQVLLGVPGDVPAAPADGVVVLGLRSSSGIVESSMKKLEMPMLLNE